MNFLKAESRIKSSSSHQNSLTNLTIPLNPYLVSDIRTCTYVISYQVIIQLGPECNVIGSSWFSWSTENPSWERVIFHYLLSFLKLNVWYIQVTEHTSCSYSFSILGLSQGLVLTLCLILTLISFYFLSDLN